jgi:hypothetical protein
MIESEVLIYLADACMGIMRVFSIAYASDAHASDVKPILAEFQSNSHGDEYRNAAKRGNGFLHLKVLSNGTTL